MFKLIYILLKLIISLIESQRKTFGDSKRPYGVGCLISGFDVSHIK